MHQNVSSLSGSFFLFVILIAIPTNHPDAHADSPDPDEIAHMKYDRTKVEGVVTKSNPVSIRLERPEVGTTRWLNRWMFVMGRACLWPGMK